MPEVTNALRSGEFAAVAGVNVQTLRYYERRGLLAAGRAPALPFLAELASVGHTS